MLQFTQSTGRSCNEMLAFYMENTLGRTSLMGADPCGEEKVPFCTKKRYEIDQVGEPDCIEFSHKKTFSLQPARQVPHHETMDVSQLHPVHFFTI